MKINITTCNLVNDNWNKTEYSTGSTCIISTDIHNQITIHHKGEMTCSLASYHRSWEELDNLCEIIKVAKEIAEKVKTDTFYDAGMYSNLKK